jgi:hypothetical protein
MAMTPRVWLALGGVALAIPAVLIGGVLSIAGNDVHTPEAAPIEWRPPMPLAVALNRPLFAVAEAQAAPADAPEVLGIAGRLDVDAVAMVRDRAGGVRTIRPGEGVDGWQLRSLSIDTAYFTRGTQQARVPLGGN